MFYHNLLKQKTILYFLAGILTVLSLFFIKPIYSQSYVYYGSDLRKKSGFVLAEKWVKTQNAKKGVFTYGPYVKLTAGEYQITLDYELSKNAEASFDIVTDKGKKLLYKGNLLSNQQSVKAKIHLDKLSELEVRTFYLGKGDLIVKQLTIIPLSLFVKYNVFLLVTLFTLFFLLYFKIFAWLMKLKWVQNKSRIDIVFLSIFFILLFLPMSNISDAEKSEQENRMLAKFPSLYVNGQINKSYGTDFEKWFNDRFAGRVFMQYMYTNLQKIVNSTIQQGRVYSGKDGWYFFKDDFDYKSLDKAQLLGIIKNIDHFYNFCQNNNIKCYIEIVPRRAEFAQDKGVRKFGKGNVDLAKEVLQVVEKNLGYDIIYPLEEMKKADKQDFVTFKTDHHWTEWGAYIGYQALMEKIKEDFPNAISVTEDDFNVFYDKRVRAEIKREFWQGSLCNSLRLSSQQCKLDTDYRYYRHKDEKNLLVRQDDKLNKFFSYPAKNNLKAIVIGNSFAENFSSFMAYTFSEYIKLRSNNKMEDNLKFLRWKDLILKEKPNILILLFESRYVVRLNTMF